MVDRLMELPDGTRLYILAPIIRGRKGEYKKEIQELQRKGFQRIRIDGQLYDIEETPTLNKKTKHDIEVLVDRVVIQREMGNRLADSLETAVELADGLVYVDHTDSGERQTFSTKFACPVSGFTIDEIEPRLFSFNSPFGACSTCDGLGVQVTFDASLIIPDETLSISQGMVAPWQTSFAFYYQQVLSAVVTFYGDDPHKAFKDLNPQAQHAILYGSGTDLIPMTIQDESRSYNSHKTFEGVIPNLERRWKDNDNARQIEELGRYQTVKSCPACGGQRLKPEALAVKIDGLNISQVTELAIDKAMEWMQGLSEKLTQKEKDIAYRILKELNERLQFLNNVGLSYLNLSRSSGTLSGGESQRIRLASQIGSGLTGVLYVLDEPSIGLHQRDNERLLETLNRLRDLDNTVIVVEHDEDAIRSADYIIDMGPGAGALGGKIIAQGTLADILSEPESLTGQFRQANGQSPFQKCAAVVITRVLRL